MGESKASACLGADADGCDSVRRSPARPPRISVESLHVKRDRVVAHVRTGSPVKVLTTPRLMQAICAVHPDLPRHACVNGVGPTFSVVMNRTTLPHLLEHLVVDLQVRACADPDRVFTGTTRWVDRPAGLARVEVSFADDLVAIRAFRDAAELINSI
jgi:hypothetical protein